MIVIPTGTDAPIYHWPYATVALIVLNTALDGQGREQNRQNNQNYLVHISLSFLVAQSSECPPKSRDLAVMFRS